MWCPTRLNSGTSIISYIYINDISTAIRCKPLLYVDDSALLVSDKKSLSSELEAAREWLINNKLSLHLGKTETILVGSKRKLHICSSIQVNMHTHYTLHGLLVIIAVYTYLCRIWIPLFRSADLRSE